jgi:hypothetical protein
VVHQRQLHTGGGDRDADHDLILDTDNSDSDGEDNLAVDGNKPKWNKKVQFSERVLNAFENSQIFELIDAMYVIFYIY